MTFHGFCAQLLKLAPQEAGVPLEFKLLEEDEARWLKAEALDEMRRRLNGRPSRDPVRQALIRRLVRLNNDWRRLSNELDGLLSRRDSLGDFLDLARVSRDAAAYRQLLEERFKMVLQPSLQDLRAGLAGRALGKAWPGFWRDLQGSPMAASSRPNCPGLNPRIYPPGKPFLKFCSPSRETRANDSLPKTGSLKALIKKNGPP